MIAWHAGAIYGAKVKEQKHVRCCEFAAEISLANPLGTEYFTGRLFSGTSRNRRITIGAWHACQLTQLESLNLSRNQLTALPESLGRLTQLQSLSLASNQLTALPESLGQLTQLQSLNLSENQLAVLPESLGQLTQLQWLNINENQFGNSFQDAAKCWKTLSSLPKLRQLFFSGNLLNKVEKRLPELLRIIANAPSLSSLFLSRNQLSEIPNEIASIGRLSTLFLDSNRLTDLPSSLGKHPHLHHLELGENPPNWRLPTRRASTPLNATCTRWRRERGNAMKPSC